MSLKNHYQDQQIDEIKNHIAKMNEEVGFIWKEISEIKINTAQTKTNLNWILKTYWIILAASLGTLITAFYNVILK